MDFLEYKGYKGSVEYSLLDDCLHGKVQGIRKSLILYEGRTLDDLRRDFQEGVDSYLEACQADGVTPEKPYSGKLNLRMPSDVHAQVAAMAAAKGYTINEYINTAIVRLLEEEEESYGKTNAD